MQHSIAKPTEATTPHPPPRRRERRPRPAKPRSTVWLSARGKSLAEIAAEGREHGAARIFLTGARPGRDGSAEEMRRWFEAVPEDAEILGWRAHSDSPALTLKFEGRPVEIRRAVDWFGEGAAPAECAAAAAELGELLASTFWGAVMFATPAMTGLDTWDRSAGSTEFPSLPAEVRDLIRETTGQGRIQVTPPPSPITEIPGLWHYDTRLAYAAIGGDGFPVTLRAHDRQPIFEGYAPGRYAVEFEVPHGWDHVGILAVRGADRWSWHYPDSPGTYGPTWADACEIQLALSCGWRVQVRERLLFAPGRPLDSWRAGMLRIWRLSRGNPLIQRAVRAILLHGIGSFARSETVTNMVRLPVTARWDGNPADVLHERYIESADEWELTVREELSSWSQRYTHPEWAAHIWARQRCRLLMGPRRAYGALTVARGDVLGMETDGLYLATDPGWNDDGEPGRMRLKSHTPGPLPAPRTMAELHELRARGETR